MVLLASPLVYTCFALSSQRSLHDAEEIIYEALLQFGYLMLLEFASLCYMFLFCTICCPCCMPAGNKIAKLNPTMRKINRMFEAGVNQLSLAEFRDIAYKGKTDGDQVVWHQTINMPITNLEWHQSHHNKTYSIVAMPSGGNIPVVNSPLHFTSFDYFANTGCEGLL